VLGLAYAALGFLGKTKHRLVVQARATRYTDLETALKVALRKL